MGEAAGRSALSLGALCPKGAARYNASPLAGVHSAETNSALGSVTMGAMRCFLGVEQRPAPMACLSGACAMHDPESLAPVQPPSKSQPPASRRCRCWCVAKLRASAHPLAWLYGIGPNEQQSWAELFEWLVVQALLHGIGTAECASDAAAPVSELRPMPRTEWTALRAGRRAGVRAHHHEAARPEPR